MSITRHVGVAADHRPDAVHAVWTNEVTQRGVRTISVHSHRAHEVLWGATGTLTVEVGPETWIIPPSIGMVIPAGVRHGGYVAARTGYRCTMIEPNLLRGRFTEPTAIAITPAWREIALRLRDDQLDGTRRRRVEQALVALTEPQQSPVVTLPLPRDDRLAQIAHALIANPSAHHDLTSWGRQTGASSRTISRRFVAETGMTFAAWRRHARVRASLVHLAGGQPVATVARLVGYRTTSAFVRAFRMTIGHPPGQYSKGVSSHAVHFERTTSDSPSGPSADNDQHLLTAQSAERSQ